MKYSQFRHVFWRAYYKVCLWIRPPQHGFSYSEPLSDASVIYAERVLFALKAAVPDVTEEQELEVTHCALNFMQSAERLIKKLHEADTLSTEIVYEDMLDAEIVFDTDDRERQMYQYWWERCRWVYSQAGVPERI